MELSAIIFRPPRIETDRLVLRGYEPSDAPNILAYASESETTRFMSWDRAKGIEDVDLFLNSFVGQHYERGELDYAVTLRGQEDRCIGGVGAYWRPREHQVMELGYILHRDYWGAGPNPRSGTCTDSSRFCNHESRADLRSNLCPQRQKSPCRRENRHAT